MDIPVLRYLDIVIGLGVVALLASTIVASATQLLLSSTFGRSRNLRDGVEDLISQIDPQLLKRHARYIAERVLRHPLVARNNTLPGILAWRIRCYFRAKRKWALPLPDLNPSDTIQREEIILILLEWAAEDGALYQQDTELVEKWRAEETRLSEVRKTLQKALWKRGVGDSEGVAQAIRLRIMQNEMANPGQPAQLWRTQAVVAAAPSDFVARVHSWYDNAIARIKQAYALEAKVVASIIAAIVVFIVQIDALSLLRQLASDDKSRTSLISEAQIQTSNIENAQKAQAASKQAAAAAKTNDATAAATQSFDKATKAEDDASQQRNEIAARLSELRDPSKNIVPAFFVWQEVAQARICTEPLGPKPVTVQGMVVVGLTIHKFNAQLNSGSGIDELGTAIRTSGAPLSVFDDGGASESCLRLVALTTAPDRIDVLGLGGAAKQSWAEKRVDTFGLQARLPGVLLMWVLVSLGSPFWYDLLKQLLGFRSMLAVKDDKERQFRQDDQVPLQSSAATTATEQATAPSDGESKPDLVTTIGSVDLHTGSPSRSAPVARTVPADTLLHIVRTVPGEALMNNDKQTNNNWYQTVDGDYLWSGAATPSVTGESGRLESI